MEYLAILEQVFCVWYSVKSKKSRRNYVNHNNHDSFNSHNGFNRQNDHSSYDSLTYQKSDNSYDGHNSHDNFDSHNSYDNEDNSSGYNDYKSIKRLWLVFIDPNSQINLMHPTYVKKLDLKKNDELSSKTFGMVITLFTLE